MKLYRIRFEVPRDANRWIEISAENPSEARDKAELKILEHNAPPIEICEVVEIESD